MLPAILGAIVTAIVVLLWTVVHCVRDCFYPEGTRGPLERAQVGDKNQLRYIAHEGPSWLSREEVVGDVNVYKT